MRLTSCKRHASPSPFPRLLWPKERPMSTFYDQKDLEEELSRVGCNDEDLDFEYLFEYEQPCSDVAGGSEGLSDALLSLCGDSSSFCPTQGAPKLPRVPKI